MKRISIFIIVIVAFASCKKEQDLSKIDLGYDYFPNTTGSFVIYRVDSTYYGLVEESYTYQIKEELAEQFIDDENRPAFKLNRYFRSGNNQPWVLIDVWSENRTTNTAERVEENIRYVKMEFPIKEGGTWDGNAMNNIPPQQYTYRNVNGFADVGIIQFNKSVTVEQLNNVNLVDQEVFTEIYAFGVGLVWKQSKDLNTQGSQISGYDVTYSAISYGTD